MTNTDFYSKIKSSFNKAAESYTSNAVLQTEVGTRLLERLEFFAVNPQTILDLGMGTGAITELLSNAYPSADIIGVDFAEAMLKTAQSKRPVTAQNYHLLCGNMNRLPIADNSVDIIFSNFSFQWCENIAALFTECRRVLKNDGLLIFTIPGPHTLYQLRLALDEVDPDYDHVNNFIDMHNIGDILVQSKFAHPVMDNDEFTLTYSSVIKLIKDIKIIGANVKLSENYRSTLFGKDKFQQLYHAYDKFKLEDNTYPLTFEVIYGHAFKLAKPVKIKHPEINGIEESYVSVDKIIMPSSRSE